MALRESALNGYSPTRKSSRLHFFWRKGEILKGERGKPTYWCMLFQTKSLRSFLVFFPFLSVFVLIFFLFFFSYSAFPFMLWKIPCFPIHSTGHGKGLFIVPAVTSVLLFCPLTAFVWSGHACQSYKTPARQRRIHFVYFVHRELILSFCVPRPFLPRC